MLVHAVPRTFMHSGLLLVQAKKLQFMHFQGLYFAQRSVQGISMLGNTSLCFHVVHTHAQKAL